MTAALHLGHALNNTLQDILVRWRRMCGDNAVWLPGTDHAGIATQTVVEKRVQREEGKRRTDFQRDEFVAKIQAWKDEYEQTILGQLKAMGCSCDWDRTAFTMDEPRSKAVREAFFRLFKDGLIYRGKRLVNWDPVTQTALADDEVENEEVDGSFFYLRYPVVERRRDEETERRSEDASVHSVSSSLDLFVSSGEFVTVATTRPETMLGDTAVAVNPKDPRAASLRGKFVKLPIVDRVIPIIEDDYVVLPIAHGGHEKDVKAQFSSGFLKVTPAHDPNDYDLGQKYKLAMINVMAPDASISLDHGWGAQEAHQKDNATLKPFVGLSREDARKQIVAWFKQHGLLEQVKPYKHTVGHSYRSHVPVEPYLSDQWYVAVRKPIPWLADEGLIEGTEIPCNSLAGLALSASRGTGFQPVADALRPQSHGLETHATNKLRLIPDRYEKTYDTWNANLRDWCISRQLWWGHRIPVWSKRIHITPENRVDQVGSGDLEFLDAGNPVKDFYTGDGLAGRAVGTISFKHVATGNVYSWDDDAGGPPAACMPWVNEEIKGEFDVFVCCKDAPGLERRLAALGYTRDPDVLDTWFSSALWPLSTLGWARDSAAEAAPPELLQWNPTSTLCTAREIITLWVSRMVMFNRYLRGHDAAHAGRDEETKRQRDGVGNDTDTSSLRLSVSPSLSPNVSSSLPLPFKDVFVHAMIQDGQGQKMSKSLGNGVDPLDIIGSHGADAMRFTLATMTTFTQDVRMPVSCIDPHTGDAIEPEMTTNSAGYVVMKPVQSYKGKRFVSSYGYASGEASPTSDMPVAKNTSPKFDLGRNFCNKLWNAARFVLGQIGSEETKRQRDGETQGTASATSSPHLSVSPSLIDESKWSVVDRWILSRLARTVQACDEALTNYRFDQYASACYDFVWRDFCDWYLEATKPAMRDEARKPHTARILATCLDTALRLMHPVIPFITEKLYWALNETGAARGIDDRFPCDDSSKLTMLSAYPQFTERMDTLTSSGAERVVERLQEIVVAIRTVRNDNKADPKKKVPVHLSCPGDVQHHIEANREFIEGLAGCTVEAIGADLAEPASSAKTTAAGVTIFVAGVVDAGAGEKRKVELQKTIAALEGRLGNPGYVDRAPPKLVEQTKQQLADAKAELAKL